MKSIKVYTIISIVIGLFQMIDGILFISNNGVSNIFNLIFSIFEFLWVPVSIVFIFLFSKNKVSILSPISYISYNVVFWIVGIVLVLQQKTISSSFKLPLWALIVGVVFGIYYMYINYMIYKKLNTNSIKSMSTGQPS